MGTFATGALANFQEAARRVGIDKDRIRDILEAAPAAAGVVWNDGALQLDPTLYSGTAEADDDLVTVTGHDLTDGTLVRITALTGGTGLTNGNEYYVVDSDTNVFSLAATAGGDAINITVDASAITVQKVADTYVEPIIREAFRQRGLYQDKADQFITAIKALDTGISGSLVVPDLEDSRWTAADAALVAAGFTTGTVTADDTDNAGAWEIGTVTDTQDPAAAATPIIGDNSVAYTVQGVPDVNDGTLTAAIDSLETDLGLVITGLGDDIDCTVVVATDVITSVGHGLEDGDRVIITAIDTATGFSAGDLVYVHSSDDDTFEVETIIGADDGDFGTGDGTLTVRKVDSSLIEYVDPDGAAADDAIDTDPVAGYYKMDTGDSIDITLGGVAVPTWSSGGNGDGSALTQAEFAAALAAADLAGDGTEGAAGTLGAVTSSTPDEGEFVAKGSVVAYTYTTAA
jgi:hypothetical protein